VGEVGTAYAEARARITDLVGGLDAEKAARRVPACPEWRVKDVVAHVTGVIDDILGGRLEGVATNPWTEAQVAARRGVPLDEIVAEWTEKAPQVEAIVDGFGPPGCQLVFDVVTHEHDLRGALGAPGARESLGVKIGLDFLANGVVASVTERGLPDLRLESGDGRRWGLDTATTCLSSSAFDLLRSCSGRRSAKQIKQLSWSGDPEPYVAAFNFGPFKVPEADIPE
jgi:uncharacterized protein (TIGR03083 family)